MRKDPLAFMLQCLGNRASPLATKLRFLNTIDRRDCVAIPRYERRL